MTTTELIDQETELKERLKDRIDATHNLGVLRGVLSLMNEIDVYELTPEEEKDIDEGIRQSKAGLGIPHETVQAEVREWFLARK